MAMRAANPYVMPASVRRRLERRGRSRVMVADQARGPNDPPANCKEHCDKYYIWPFWQDCMDRCEAKEWFTAAPGGSQPAPPTHPCGYQQRWCETLGMCVPDIAGACPAPQGITSQPAQPAQPAVPSGIRRTQMAMGGRLSNPRQGW